jgi:pimeloyl-ACP methyl ester carboxylesterase
MPKPATFVLVSGSWHAGWCWELVKPLLEARGHRVLAPDLLGMGGDRTPLQDVTLARWADQIADLIRAQSDPVILVGHSRGGIVISETAERVPDRIACLVYLAAFLVPNGESLVATAERHGDALENVRAAMIVSPDGTSTISAELGGATFYNTTPAALVARAVGLLMPEPMAASVTPLQLTQDRFGRVPRAYIEAEFDNAISITLQRAMHREMPCQPVITLKTDHSPFYSSPGELAEALEKIAGN